MRVSDDRFSRDCQRIDLALRFIHHEARSSCISAQRWPPVTITSLAPATRCR